MHARFVGQPSLVAGTQIVEHRSRWLLLWFAKLGCAKLKLYSVCFWLLSHTFMTWLIRPEAQLISRLTLSMIPTPSRPGAYVPAQQTDDPSTVTIDAGEDELNLVGTCFEKV